MDQGIIIYNIRAKVSQCELFHFIFPLSLVYIIICMYVCIYGRFSGSRYPTHKLVANELKHMDYKMKKSNFDVSSD